jgi:hypothetical protein
VVVIVPVHHPQESVTHRVGKVSVVLMLLLLLLLLLLTMVVAMEPPATIREWPTGYRLFLPRHHLLVVVGVIGTRMR